MGFRVKNGAKVHNTRFTVQHIVEGFEMDYTLTVTGMTCEHCEKTVVRAVRQLDRSAQVHADRTQNRVEVTTSLAREAVAEAITQEGFTVAA